MNEIKSDNSKEQFFLFFQNALFSYNVFVKNFFFSEAYESLTICLEINEQFKYLISQDITDMTLILQYQQKLEKKLELSEYKITSCKFIDSKVDLLDPAKDIPPEKLDEYFNLFTDMLDIPKERIENMKSELRDWTELNKRVNTKYFDVLTNLEHTKSKETISAEKSKFVIVCKKCGYETDESTDINYICEQLKREHPHICF